MQGSRFSLDDLRIIMSDDHHLRIEVGYGLEGQLTNAYTSRIINDVIKPKIVAGDRVHADPGGIDIIARHVRARLEPALPQGELF